MRGNVAAIPRAGTAIGYFLPAFHRFLYRVIKAVDGNHCIFAYMLFAEDILLKELTFKTSRSGGKGGQNVNKVSSKVDLNFDIASSEAFTPEQKERLLEKLSARINARGILQITTEEDRSQLRNKEKSVEKLFLILRNALHERRLRKATRPGKAAVEKRLKQKQLQALKKLGRRQGGWE